MKPKLVILLFLFFSVQIQAQEKNIKTESVLINDLISFVVNNYSAEDGETFNITFLIQTRANNMSAETKMLLKQGFKLISERLSEDSTISIITYTHFNGLVLEPTNVKELKLILNTLSDLKGNLSEPVEDGMGLAFKRAEINYDENIENSVVILRNNDIPNLTANTLKSDKKAKKKEKNKAIIGIALAVLPELISAIKD